MVRSKRVKGAEFWRLGTLAGVDIFLSDIEGPISIDGTLVRHCAKKLSERELEETIEILEHKAKVMTKQRNFPLIYDEMLTELKDVLEERYR